VESIRTWAERFRRTWRSPAGVLAIRRMAQFRPHLLEGVAQFTSSKSASATIFRGASGRPDRAGSGVGNRHDCRHLWIL